jgi:type VI secretion system secreted protein VgrG
MSTIKTLSSKGGGGFNEIRFEDKKDEEQIFIHAQKNVDTRIKNDVYEEIGRDEHVAVKRNRIVCVEKDSHETVKQDELREIGRDSHLKIVGKQAVEIQKSRSLTVSGDVIEVFKANHSEETTGEVYLKARAVVIEASQGLTLKSGSNSVVVDSVGVTLTGSLVVLDGKSVMIASGSGSPAASGSAGSAVSPKAPELPLEPDKADPGEVLKLKAEQAASGTGKYGKPESKAFTPAAADAEKKPSFIEIELVDEKGKPVPGEPYKLTLPDGSTTEGTLDEKGFVRIDGMEPGDCKVTFPRLDREAWKKA